MCSTQKKKKEQQCCRVEEKECIAKNWSILKIIEYQKRREKRTRSSAQLKEKKKALAFRFILIKYLIKS